MNWHIYLPDRDYTYCWRVDAVSLGNIANVAISGLHTWKRRDCPERPVAYGYWSARGGWHWRGGVPLDRLWLERVGRAALLVRRTSTL